MGILTYSPLGGGWLSGRWRKDNAATPTSAARPKARFDMTSPANQRKLEIVESSAQLAEQAGMTLIELAIAFVINHPAVTAAIIGPRTMEQLESQLPAADVTLTATSSTGSTSSSPRASRSTPTTTATAKPNSPWRCCGASPHKRESTTELGSRSLRSMSPFLPEAPRTVRNDGFAFPGISRRRCCPGNSPATSRPCS